MSKTHLLGPVSLNTRKSQPNTIQTLLCFALRDTFGPLKRIYPEQKKKITSTVITFLNILSVHLHLKILVATSAVTSVTPQPPGGHINGISFKIL